MPEMEKVGNSFRKVLLLLVLLAVLPVLSGAEKVVDLTGFLPRHAAVVFGSNLAALCRNEQSAVVFKPLSERFPAFFPSASGAVFACDILGQRRNWLVSFHTPEHLEFLWKMAEKRFASSGAEIDGRKVFYLKGSPGARKGFRLLRLNEEIAAVYTRYPQGDKTIPDCSGMVKNIADYLPRRADVLLWGYGIPRIPKPYLQDIVKFSFALEPGVDGQLHLHGEVIFTTPASAMLANTFISGLLAGLLEKKFSVPAKITRDAVRVLAIRRDKNILRFSSGRIEPVLLLAAKIVEAEASSWEAVVK